ncbi:hypothetical protein SLEP1_g8693 [Rubroshorea leprosula]|uniref:Uncharacterized protein n=1 Tax=Rubroshorea leprosula TaxID=152421 RepID=A0AAV5IDG5_9ROSI|nr:hypothetical protein SLEP1_g8693 [Rubroshorea leprosula]
MSEVVNGNFWNWPFARSPQLVQIQMALLDSLYPKSGNKDLLIWTAPSSRVFKTSSAWHSLQAKQGKVPWHMFPSIVSFVGLASNIGQINNEK